MTCTSVGTSEPATADQSRLVRRYQLEILGLIRQLGVPTIAALHDLNLAAAYSHLHQIAGLKLAAYRYEYEYLRNSTLVGTSVAQHLDIVSALGEANL